MQHLKITYSVWESVLTANPARAYYKFVRGNTVFVFTGHEDVVFESDTGDEAAFDIAHPSAVAVASKEDAIASLIGLTRPVTKRAFDGSQVVASQSLTLGQERFLRTDDGSAKMNVDGSSTGAVTVAWSGTGDTGGDWSQTGIGSEQAGAARDGGAAGWDTGVAALNDNTRFDNGSLFDADALYNEVTFWIQPKAFPAGSKLRISWRDASNSLVGNTVKVIDYVTNMDLDVWQQVTIPVADFNLAGANVQKLQFKYVTQAGQHHWLDDIELVASAAGGPYRFRLQAPADICYHVSTIVLVIQGADVGWNSDAFGTVAGGLSNGLIIRQRRLSDAEILFSLNSKDNTDLFGRFHPQEDFAFADNVTIVGLMLKPGKASIVVTDDDVLEFVVRDDLSGIGEMRAFAHFGVEDRS